MMKRVGDAVERRLNQPRTPTFRPVNESVARGLGWFSISLGLAEVLMPRALATGLGMAGRERLIVLYGLREIACGVGLLFARRKTPWMWARVAGDALDIATLAPNLRGDGRLGPAVGLAAVAGVAVLDAASATQLSGRDRRRAIRVDYSDRSGFPRPAEQMRGAARADFKVPEDMRNALPAPAQSQGELKV